MIVYNVEMKYYLTNVCYVKHLYAVLSVWIITIFSIRLSQCLEQKGFGQTPVNLEFHSSSQRCTGTVWSCYRLDKVGCSCSKAEKEMASSQQSHKEAETALRARKHRSNPFLERSESSDTKFLKDNDVLLIMATHFFT